MYIMTRTSYIQLNYEDGVLFYKSNTLNWMFIVLAHWNISLQLVDLSIHWHIIQISNQLIFVLTP